jgi:hypothetical protein
MLLPLPIAFFLAKIKEKAEFQDMGAKIKSCYIMI